MWISVFKKQDRAYRHKRTGSLHLSQLCKRWLFLDPTNACLYVPDNVLLDDVLFLFCFSKKYLYIYFVKPIG